MADQSIPAVSMRVVIFAKRIINKAIISSIIKLIQLLFQT